MSDVERFRAAYSHFLRPGRILLTGHSHQAWPDAARDAQQHYFDDSARWVDDKWEHAIFPVLERVGHGVLGRMGFPAEDAIAFGRSTHELVYRLLSCFKADRSFRVVTTTSEFHSLYRQLSRLREEGCDVVFVDATERATLAARVEQCITPGTSLVAMSAVLFEDSYVVPGMADVLARARSVGAAMLVDAYHAFNVVPLNLGDAAEHAFVVAGGYKYAQFGEGLCWMRLPPAAQSMRPAYTGWFADFAALSRPRGPEVGYGSGGARFAGATWDGSALYRADAVLQHFQRFGMDLPTLRARSLHQTGLVMESLAEHGVLDKAPLVTPRDPSRRGGFVTLRHGRAGEIVTRLRERDVWVDSRGDLLRIGPAPYLLDQEILDGCAAVRDVVAGLA